MGRREAEAAVALLLILLGSVLTFDVSNSESVEYGAAQPNSVDWWTMFHHDVVHTGYSTSTAPNTNNTLWSYTTGDIVWSSPVVADGRVFVGSDDKKVHALNATTGAFLWSYTTGDYVWSTPAVAAEKVFVGSSDGKIYALNAETGAFVWSYTTDDWVTSSPAVADGKIFVGSWDWNIYALDGASGTRIWNYTTGGPVESSPAVADGKVFVGSDDGKIYALSALSGSFLWSYQTEGFTVSSSPTVVDGKVFFGSDDDKVYALSEASGGFLWSYPTSGGVYSSPAVVGGRVFVGSWDSKIYALNASTGAFVWSYLTGNLVDSSPAVADGKVFVGSSDGKVYALNATTGTRIWSYTTGGDVYSSPAVADDKVFVASFNNKVYAFGPPPRRDVAVTSVTPLKTVVGRGYACRINVTVENEGNVIQNLTVTAYDDSRAIETKAIRDLAPNAQATLTFTWNTLGISYGNHVISATANLPSGEIDVDPVDNSRIDGVVLVTIAGDIDGDGMVNVFDVYILGKAYNSVLGGLGWNFNADINDNNRVDDSDLSITCNNFGKTT